METDPEVFQGVVRGKLIELDEETGLPDGQAVSIRVLPATSPGDGIRRSAGAWTDGGEELDEWLAAMRRSRQAERPAAEA